ncbi:ABC transporter substrate-binding protein [Advenella sp. RU8]|uniref:ABC transporter substrate-binding protein n=1 Tax=Advenella sp. RU8 TaxID=3399575 RepID=UPI003AB0747B
MNIKPLILAGMLAMASVTSVAQTNETLKIGVEALYPPFESKAPDGTLIGFDIELGEAVCAKMQVTCEWEETSFDGLIPALNARKFDFINSAMDITAARQKVINFTQPVYVVPSQLLVKKGSGLQPTPESLKDLSIGVLQGSSQEAFVRKHWGKKGVKIVSYAAQDQIYQDLANGRIHGAVQNSPSALESFLNRPEGAEYELVEPLLHDPDIFGEGIAFGLRKNDKALKQRLDAAIQELKNDGTIGKLSEKYFNANWVAK